jgi:CRISPR/Cas system-associated endoribonuclease Cas2
MSFVIVFDIPKALAVERVRINRKLNRVGAVRIQDSFWRSDRLNDLINIGIEIRKIGGKSEILEEKFLL